MKTALSCSIVGARGYAGLELAKILLAHPQADLTHCFATGPFELAKSLSSQGAQQVTCLLDHEVMSHLTDVVFLATPAEVSMRLAPQIIEAGKKVIDLSGAFRLREHEYETWYGFAHTAQKLLQESHYGLVPFSDAVSLGRSRLIANPGCFATAILMAMTPLLKHRLIREEGIVIDAKSGTTGAGRKAADHLLFSEVEGDCSPYKIGRHQHYPEILEALKKFAKAEIDAHMTTSLLPVRRGIIAAVYAHLNGGVDDTDIERAFRETYENDPLVEWGCSESSPEFLSLRKVVGTAKTRISWVSRGSKLYVFSCLDNLMKGAASQAVENFNRISDVPAWTGLRQWEVVT